MVFKYWINRKVIISGVGKECSGTGGQNCSDMRAQGTACGMCSSPLATA